MTVVAKLNQKTNVAINPPAMTVKEKKNVLLKTNAVNHVPENLLKKKTAVNMIAKQILKQLQATQQLRVAKFPTKKQFRDNRGGCPNIRAAFLYIVFSYL